MHLTWPWEKTVHFAYNDLCMCISTVGYKFIILVPNLWNQLSMNQSKFTMSTLKFCSSSTENSGSLTYMKKNKISSLMMTSKAIGSVFDCFQTYSSDTKNKINNRKIIQVNIIRKLNRNRKKEFIIFYFDSHKTRLENKLLSMR